MVLQNGSHVQKAEGCYLYVVILSVSSSGNVKTDRLVKVNLQMLGLTPKKG